MIHSALRAAKVAFFGAAVLLTAGLTSASALTITFDDVDTAAEAAIPDGYSGLNWGGGAQWSTVNPSDPSVTNPSGYQNSVTSGNWSAFNIEGNDAQISSTGFNLISGNFTAAWNDNLQLTITGSGGQLATLTLSTSGPTFFAFNWTNLTSVIFSATGGTHHAGFGGSGTEFAVDDLAVTAATTPIPGSLLLLLTGVGTIGAIGYTRRQRAAA